MVSVPFDIDFMRPSLHMNCFWSLLQSTVKAHQVHLFLVPNYGFSGNDPIDSKTCPSLPETVHPIPMFSLV